MKKNIILTLVAFLLFASTFEASAQRSQRRQQRKHRKTEQRLDDAKRKGELSADEKSEVAKREDKYHRKKNKATRDGVITDSENRKLNRKNRRLNREVRQSEDK